MVIAAVLIVQCLLFGDGGLMALGANFLNMGLVGAVIGFAIYTAIRRLIGGQNGILLGAMFAAWLSVVLSAGAFSIELAFSHRGPGFIRVLSLMTLVHAVIGVGEALITGLVIRFILLSRPDLIDGLESETGGQGKRTEWAPVAASGFAIALAVGIFAAPFASSYSDGLEYVGGPDQLHFASTEDKSRPAIAPLLPDYQFPALERISLKVATAVAGAIGTVVVFGLGLGLAWSMDRLKTGRQALVLAGADAGDARDEP